MIKKSVAATIMITLLSTFASAVQNPAPAIFDSPEGRFAVWLPTKPEVATREVDSAVGKLTMYIYSSSTNTAYLMVSFGDYPNAPADSAGADRVLEGVQTGVIKGLAGVLVSEKKISLNSYPGREFKVTRTVEGRDTVFHWQTYLVGRRLYQLGIALDKANAESPDVTKFFGSFQIKP